MEAPKICCLNNQLQSTSTNIVTVVNWTNPLATDNSGQSATVNCKPGSGSEFGIGATTVICKAIDPSENEATCVFTVLVIGNLNVLNYFLKLVLTLCVVEAKQNISIC